MDSDLGAKVKKLRISQGLTQEDVAKALDVTPGYISNVENGRFQVEYFVKYEITHFFF